MPVEVEDEVPTTAWLLSLQLLPNRRLAACSEECILTHGCGSATVTVSDAVQPMRSSASVPLQLSVRVCC